MSKPNETTKKPQGASRAVWIAALAIFLFTASAPLWATDEEGTRAALHERGLKPVMVGRYDSLACFSDLFATRFAAEDKEGKIVRGTACSTPGIARVRLKFEETD